MYTKTISQPIVLAVTILAVCSLWWTSTALANCGDIITVYDYGDGQGAIDEREPIIDCTNPFNVDTPAPFAYELTLAGQAIVENTVVSVIESEPVSGFYSLFDRSNNFSYAPFQLFQQEGEDFRQVAVINNQNFTLEPLPAGEYTAVLLYEEPPIIMVEAEPLWKQWFQSWFMPATAHAFFEDYAEVVAISFTIEYEAPTPTGASSVLFLPGIQASRLYIEEDGAENQLWEPNRNADVEKLAMTEEGVSVNEVYTRDVLDEVNVLPIGQENIYKGFLSMLDDMVEYKEIASTTAFAYDWRYSVQDVVTGGTRYQEGIRSLVSEIERLAAGSYTGKVTIVAHSNGGLIAKMLIRDLELFDEEYLVDKVVFIGTPQLGTPKAIGSMLHGYDQSLGLGSIATANTVRQVTKNMPGAYTLLPSSEYFNKTNEPVITTDGSILSQAIADYGEIDTAQKLQNYVLDGLDNRGEAVGLNEPITLNAQLSTNALSIQNILDTWQAPTGIAVYEVVGTGLATVKGFEYRAYSCAEGNAFCVLNVYLAPFPIMTNDGDQTVVSVSAAGYDGDKTIARVNLYDAAFLKPKTHVNMTESNQVQDFVKSVIRYPYLGEAIVTPEFTVVSSQYRIIGAHSPVSLLALDKTGKKVGIIDGELKEEISGSQYFELGEGKYLVLPREADVSVVVQGTGEGVYSLSVDEINEAGEQRQVSLLAGASSTPTMIAQFSIENDEYSLIKTDLDGDGETDLEQTLDGEVIDEPNNNNYTYEDLELAIKELGLKRKYEKKLLVKVHLAEFFFKKSNEKRAFNSLVDRIHRVITRELKRYYRKGIISESDFDFVKEITNNIN